MNVDLERNPRIGITGPADTMDQCAQVLQINDLAITGNEDASNREDTAMGHMLILTAVRYALMWEAERSDNKRAEPGANVSQLPATD